jgi:hypothetical protein
MLLFKFTSILLLFSRIGLFVSATEQQKPHSPIRITFFLTKSANITEEEFHHHWSTHHAPLVTPWLKRYNILEYNQVDPPNSRSKPLYLI